MYNEAFKYMIDTYGSLPTAKMTRAASERYNKAKAREKRIIWEDPESYIQTYKKPTDQKGILIDLLLRQYPYGSQTISKELKIILP